MKRALIASGALTMLVGAVAGAQEEGRRRGSYVADKSAAGRSRGRRRGVRRSSEARSAQSWRVEQWTRESHDLRQKLGRLTADRMAAERR